jgi:hypothetical protein
MCFEKMFLLFVKKMMKLRFVVKKGKTAFSVVLSSVTIVALDRKSHLVIRKSRFSTRLHDSSVFRHANNNDNNRRFANTVIGDGVVEPTYIQNYNSFACSDIF